MDSNVLPYFPYYAIQDIEWRVLRPGYTEMHFMLLKFASVFRRVARSERSPTTLTASSSTLFPFDTSPRGTAALRA